MKIQWEEGDCVEVIEYHSEDGEYNTGSNGYGIYGGGCCYKVGDKGVVTGHKVIDGSVTVKFNHGNYFNVHPMELKYLGKTKQLKVDSLDRTIFFTANEVFRIGCQTVTKEDAKKIAEFIKEMTDAN